MRLAARGARNMDQGEEPIRDPALLRRLRRQARRVNLESLLIGLALTALVLALPG